MAELAGAILRIRDLEESERQAMGRKGRAYVSRYNSRAVLAERYFGILRKITRSDFIQSTAPSADPSRGRAPARVVEVGHARSSIPNNARAIT